MGRMSRRSRAAPATSAGRSSALLERSNRLGADPRNTNYAGGNTSAKGIGHRPGDRHAGRAALGQGLRRRPRDADRGGLAVLRLDRLRALVDVYPGVEREDEMVAAFDYCLHGRGGAAPSIDTAMHGLVDAGHVDHLHPDSGIALATAADGEALTRRCFGDRVAWVDWRRPGFQLGLDIAAIRRERPGGDRGDPRRARDHGLGRHLGRSARRARSRSSGPPSGSSPSTAGPSRSGRRSPGYEPLPESRAPRPRGRPPAARSAVSPRPTGRRSATTPTATSSSTSSPGRSTRGWPRSGTSCPDHFLRTKVRPMVLDLPPTAELETVDRPAARAPRRVPGGVPRLLRAPRDGR